MLKKCSIALVLILVSVSILPLAAQEGAASESEAIIVYRLPEPERLYIHRNGMVVYDAKIPASSIVNNGFILPANIQMDSFTIAQGGSRVYSYSLETTEELVALRRGERPSLVRVLHVKVPEIKPNIPLEVKYGISNSGITWEIRLDMELGNNNTLDCSLLAMLNAGRELPDTTQSILARRPEIILTASQNTLLENSTTMFNLGNPLIEANKRIQIKLDEGKTNYAIVYSWNANYEERPDAYLRAPNPFKSVAASVRAFLNSSGMNITTFSLSLSPDRPFNFRIGSQPNIRTFKSVTTAEFPERENLPYTHTMEYRVTNLLDSRVSIEVSVPVFYGREHRTQYHFTKEPDERPGDNMVWKFELDPGKDGTVKFSFDAESKDAIPRSEFDYSSGGGR
jgi:hypothetical protein